MRAEGEAGSRVCQLGCLALAGCAATGVKVDEARVRQFERGKTMVSEVVGALGAPTMRMVMPDGMTSIIYTYAEAAAPSL